jgi:leucyl-tRNA synthetase
VTHETYSKRDRAGRLVWLLPEEVERGADGTLREHATGEPVNVGPTVKMSKSKRNVVDPERIIDQYGADTARWFMLSDSPPDRDVEWTAAGVEGAWRFLQRVWRTLDEAPPETAIPTSFGPEALALRRTTHATIAGVTEGIEGFTFNKAVARLHELANALARADGAGADMAFARREGFDALARLMAPMIPHFAEELWSRLGHTTMLVDEPWPEAEPALLSSETVLLPVQVNGKKRGEIQMPKGAARDAVEQAALAEPSVARILEGRAPKKVIVVPERIVNVVV